MFKLNIERQIGWQADPGLERALQVMRMAQVR
jgi:hypothetical protein